MARAPGRLALFASPLLAVLCACSGPLPLDDRPLGVVEGLAVVAPSFVVEASPVHAGEGLLLEVRAAVAHADLVFVPAGEGYRARLAMSFAVRDRHGRELIAAHEVTDSVRVASRADTRAPRQVVLIERFEVPQGRLLAEVSLRNERGDARATRRVAVSIPERGDGPVPLPPRLKRGGDVVVGAHLARWHLADSVRVFAEAHDGSGAARATLTLVRGRSERGVPTPPFWINPPRGSLAHAGARFGGEGTDTVLVAVDPGGGILLPLLEEEVYVLAASAGRGPPAARPLIVLPKDHPRVTTVEGLIEALAYIAYPSELEPMREATDAAERRRLFDAFWGSLFEVRPVAEAVMRLYFERVEEANRLFTTHQPGWRTDRGMVYVMLGPPATVERLPDGEVWHYGRRLSAEAYFFERVRYEDSPWPLDHYVLRRSPRYEVDWQRALRRWRRGEVR